MSARQKSRGLVYLRRSSSKQELSLAGQLAWAIERAAKDGVRLNADLADLDHMLAHGLHRQKGIFLDNAISGSDMNRPGFLAFCEEAKNHREVSHLYSHMRDRLARPDDAMEMARIECGLRSRGVTFVFCNGIGEPFHGQADIGEQLKLLVEYYLAGDFLIKLAERIVAANRTIAGMGHWAGGCAPYGFVRVFVDAQGNDVCELADNQTMRQPGCYVQLRPKDLEKIKWWLFILDLADVGWGVKRIANYLNELGVPSPNAGRVRKVRGVPRVHDGKWNHTTVLDLIRNPAVIGSIRFARRSMGQFRRAGANGPRPLTEADKTSSGKPKVIRNPKSLQVIAPGGYDPKYDTSKWDDLQRKVDERGRSQRGIPRSLDPGKYPLSCRIIDMTNGCGATMFGRTSGERPIYVCGRYEKNGPTACDNNSVDAEAMLSLVGQFFQGFMGPALESRLRQIWSARHAQEQSDVEQEAPSAEIETLRLEGERLNAEKEQLRSNMRRGLDEALLRDLNDDYRRLNQRIDQITGTIAKLERLSTRSARSADEEIGAAIELLKNFEVVLKDPTARGQLQSYFQRFGLRIGLNFKEGRKGPKRKVRVLSGGMLVLNNRELPVALHGRDRVEENAACCDSGETAKPAADRMTPEEGDPRIADDRTESREVRDPRTTETPDADASGKYNSRGNMHSIEGISSAKVSRGDRI